MLDLIGLVSYVDAPDAYFRIVYPQVTDPDNVLDDPQWVTMGCDPERSAVLVKMAPDDPRIIAFQASIASVSVPSFPDGD